MTNLGLQDFALFDRLFPNANVTASTLGAFFDLIDGNPKLRATLPRLGSEIGDTWMYGNFGPLSLGLFSLHSLAMPRAVLPV